jgi:uncharacterized protein
MAREVFVDTSGLYALADRKDLAHEAASKLIAKFYNTKTSLVLTDYVLDETLTLASVRSGPQAALKVLDLTETSRFFRMLFIDSERFNAAKFYFRKHADQGYSFTDCTSFVLMKELRLQAALTTDSHFHKAGFEALLQTP